MTEVRVPVQPEWRKALDDQRRTLVWLAQQTDRSVDTVRSYAIGRRTPPADWLAKVDALLRRESVA